MRDPKNDGRDGYFPFAFPTAYLTQCEEITLRTRVLDDRETYRVEELFVPGYLVGSSLVEVFGFGIDCGERGDPENRMLSPEPVLIDAFAKYPIESFDIFTGHSVYVKLRNLTHVQIQISLAVRGRYTRLRHG